MEFYDVVIVGSGVAGCGLVNNLNKLGYSGKILLLDKKWPGSSAAYGYRNVPLESIREYGLSWEHKFKGLKMDFGGDDLTIDKTFYFVNYSKMCKELISRKDFDYKVDVAQKVSGNILKTKKSEFGFKYLIDCSGPSFFLRKLFNLPLPFKYFIGKLHNVNVEPKCEDRRYFYFHSKSNGYVEDYYPLKGKVIHGDWWLTDKVDFGKFYPQKYDLARRFGLDRDLIPSEFRVVEPISPVYPLSSRKFGFLGDSFGNATPVTGQGVPFALKSSKMMAQCIKENKLENFQSVWKKKFLNLYQRTLAPKMHQGDRLVVLELLKDHPYLLEKLLSNEEFKIPKSLIRKIPKNILFKDFYHYLRLKLRYFFMENKIYFNDF